MSAKRTSSRIEPTSQSTAKPIASPRAEVHAKGVPAKPGKKTAVRAGAEEGDSAAMPEVRAKKGKTGKAKLVKSELAYQGKVFNVYRDTVIEPGGRENTREVIRHNGSVVVLGVDDTKDAADPEVVLIRQYRHAAGQFLIELPAGRIDKGEVPLAAAKREMIEETGFRAKQWTLLVKYFASPGFLGEWMQIYLARGITPGVATPEEDEQIELMKMPLSEAMGLVAGGKIHDGKTLISLSLFDAGRKAGRF